MIKKALEYIVGLKNPDVRKIDGQTYSDKELFRINHNPKASAIKLNTLSSLVDYLDAEFDTRGKLFIHVVDPLTVMAFSALDEDRKREHLVQVNGYVPRFDYNRYIDHEEFCINLQSKFVDSSDRALLLKFAGTVESGTVAEYGDDGVTQKATIKTGVASKEAAIVPNPVSLQGYRTFIEVEQPTTQYVFRMKQGLNGGVQCGLFEADGGAWEIEAMQNIKDYLEGELSKFSDVVVIS